MAKKKKIPEKYQRWIDARKRYHLSHAHIQMAKDYKMYLDLSSFSDDLNSDFSAS